MLFNVLIVRLSNFFSFTHATVVALGLWVNIATSPLVALYISNRQRCLRKNTSSNRNKQPLSYMFEETQHKIKSTIKHTQNAKERRAVQSVRINSGTDRQYRQCGVTLQPLSHDCIHGLTRLESAFEVSSIACALQQLFRICWQSTHKFLNEMVEIMKNTYSLHHLLLF